MVAEGFDAREVGHALPRAVQQRLVHAEVVRVAMDVGNGFAERDHLGTKRDQEVMEAVRRLLRIVFHQGIRVARRCTGTVRIVKARIGLRDEHHGHAILRDGGREGVLHPLDARRIAGGVFHGIRVIVAEVVAGALNVDRRVHHRADNPAAVLHAGNVGVRGSLRLGDVAVRARIGVGTAETLAQRCCLNLLEESGLAQRVRRVKEECALVIELLERVSSVRAQALAIAIGPVVVTGREDSGSMEAAEVDGRPRIDAAIGAVRRSTALPQIAVMGREGEILRVHIGDQVRENGGLLGGIRQVTPQADGVGAAALLVDAIGIVFVLAVGVALPVVPVKGTRHSEGQGGQARASTVADAMTDLRDRWSALEN